MRIVVEPFNRSILPRAVPHTGLPHLGPRLGPPHPQPRTPHCRPFLPH
jgi:hypothetical protein